MNNKKILVDIDDTIEDLLETWLKYLNQKYGYNVLLKDITDWDISSFFPELTREQVFEPLHNNEFWKTVKPKRGAAECLERLIYDGFDIYLCTSTDYRNIKAKYEYIVKEYFPFIEWNHVIVVSKNK